MGKPKPEPEKPDEFIVLFTALSMILLAFFILLNTMAVIDPMRSRKAMDSLVGTFGIMVGNIDGEEVSLSQKKINQQMMMALIAEIKDDERYAGMSASRREPGKVVIELDEGLFFSSGGWHVDPRRFQALDELASVIQKTDYNVTIIGHTDARASKQVSNLRLSAARAASVRRYLEHSAHFPPGTISSIGVGASRPHPEVKDPDHARHRRVEIVITIDEPTP